METASIIKCVELLHNIKEVVLKHSKDLDRWTELEKEIDGLVASLKKELLRPQSRSRDKRIEKHLRQAARWISILLGL
jgi:hypothetical protein